MDHTHQECCGHPFAGNITHDQRNSVVLQSEDIIEIAADLFGRCVLRGEMNSNIFLRQGWQQFRLDLTCNLELFFKMLAMRVGAEPETRDHHSHEQS